MKKLLLLPITFLLSYCTFAQNVGVGTKAPAYPLTLKDSLGVGYGFGHVSPNGQVALGTYVNNTNAYIQTHTNTDLKFATNDQSYQMIIQTGTGNVGIGSVVPTQKLEVAGNVKVNGTLQVMGGTPGAGKVLTSDAAGNASWKATAYGNTERFQFKLSTVVNNGAPQGVLTTIYNTGTAIPGVSAPSNQTDKRVTINISKPGLYHFDWVSTSLASGVSTSGLIPFTIYNTNSATEIYRYLGRYSDDPVSDYLRYDVNHHASFDLYLPAAAILYFTAPFISTSTADTYQSTITGHMISE